MKSKIYVRYKANFQSDDLNNPTLMVEQNLIETLDGVTDLWQFLQKHLHALSTGKDFERFQCLFGNIEDKRFFLLKLTKVWRFKTFPFGRMLAEWEVDEFFDLSKDTRLPITTVVV